MMVVMQILEDLLSYIHDDAPVRSILVGAHWTVVCSRNCGMAATMITSAPHAHAAVRDAGHLHAKSARQLAEYALSENILEASIGMAAINSLLDIDESRAIEINAVDVLAKQGKLKNVALVGHFPFIPRLRAAVNNLWVIEQHPVEGDYPAEAAGSLIPQAQVVAITSSALINHTLDGLLAICQPGVLVMMLGPSTPLSEVLFNHGVSLLAGSKIIDEQAVIRTVGQGATFQQVEGARLLTLGREVWNLS
jgi:uncharacterized protein (DUF4213/DUF364 family)